MSAAVDPLIGSVVAGRYEVIRVIGQGGMGTIYEVRNTRLGRSFALKTLSSGLENGEILARFRREAEIVASLNHANILDVVDWDTLADGSPCMVMEYLRGEDLSTRVRSTGPLAWPDFARIADQVLAALAVAHRAGVIHRDLKPQNIFLAADDNGDESVKLLDFGISKLRDSRTFTTTDAKVIGTPAYMPPEQAEGRQEDIGPPSDVWAMGAILYEMATGIVAFDGASIPAILYKVCHGRPRPILELRVDTPAKLVALIEHTLMPRVADRIATAEKLRSDLREALANIGGISWPEPLRARDAGRRIPTPLSGVAVAPTLAAGSAAVEPSVAASLSSQGQPSRLPAVASSPSELGARALVPETGGRRRWPLGVALIAIAVGAGVAIRASSHDAKTASPPDQAASGTPAATSPTVQLPETPAPARPPARTPDKVTIKIESTPAGAEIFRLPSEAMVGVTPWADDIDRFEGTGVFVVKKLGFKDSRVEIDLRAGGTKRVELARLPGVRTVVKTSVIPAETPHPERKKGDPIDPFAGQKHP